MWPNQVTSGFTSFLGECCLQSPTSMSLGNFTAWSVGRVPFWWSGAYVRAPAAIKSGNCGSIKHGYESWGSLLCLVVSGGGSWQNRSCLAVGILGEAIWNSSSFLSKNNFQKKIIENHWSIWNLFHERFNIWETINFLIIDNILEMNIDIEMLTKLKINEACKVELKLHVDSERCDRNMVHKLISLNAKYQLFITSNHSRSTSTPPFFQLE